MSFLNRRQATWTILGAQFPISSLAQTRSSPQPDANNEYSPPTATVIIIVIALFLTVGFLSIYFRHFGLCLGFGGSRGGAWRRYSARGLDSQMVESFPTFPYSEVKVHRIGKGTLECAVCLTEFSDDEVLLILPVCSHVFHRDCIVPWLASHVTCPVCRANLEFQHRRQHCDVLLEHLRQLSDEEFQPSDHHDHDHNLDVGPAPENTITIKTPVQEIKDGVEHMGKLPRSHSTGHSLVGDCERFTLRLPLEVRNKLVTANQSILPAMISPRIGYRARSVGWTGFPVRPDRWRFSASPPFISRPGSTASPTPNSAGVMNVPRNLFTLIKSPLNRGKPRYISDIGERSSDKLWPIHRPHDLESDRR